MLGVMTGVHLLMIDDEWRDVSSLVFYWYSLIVVVFPPFQVYQATSHPKP